MKTEPGSPSDKAEAPPLANSDRGKDPSTCYRDAIDLGILVLDAEAEDAHIRRRFNEPGGDRMGSRIELTEAARHDLAQRYADGEMTLAEIRARGVWRMTQLLSDLGAIGRRPPMAVNPEPDQEERRAGVSRLDALMAR